MKYVFRSCVWSLCLLVSFLTYAVETPSIKLGSYIELTPKVGQAHALSDLLGKGLALVKANEPDTLFWAALSSKGQQQFVIFDGFETEPARNAHFAGEVPIALRSQAETLIQKGWEKGVVTNIHNATVIASRSVIDVKKPVLLATFIPLKAKKGQEKALADFLKMGAHTVSKTEPNTLYWFGLHFGENNFGIIDFFPDQKAIDTHFKGKVTAYLKMHAAHLLEGGWENGIVKHIQYFNVIHFLAR